MHRGAADGAADRRAVISDRVALRVELNQFLSSPQVTRVNGCNNRDVLELDRVARQGRALRSANVSEACGAGPFFEDAPEVAAASGLFSRNLGFGSGPWGGSWDSDIVSLRHFTLGLNVLF